MRKNVKNLSVYIYTTKVDKVGHGIGISSIKYITDKYNGEVVINYSDDEFILNIMIPIPS
ncbi:GHKL domain-containing protein [Turicibacter sp. TJ11]|uniref:GHKL domain-containing protein n=1 Tax=Turicibacter sp. TJ11 TaxID=2806443 RepID=UPI001F37768A|nr:GHKL domain-containing protein [Turicibacter sp. TJ11]